MNIIHITEETTEFTTTKIAEFTTTKSGRKDLKKDGGTHRGRHTVRVVMDLGQNFRAHCAQDIEKIKSADLEGLKDKLVSRGLVFTEQDFETALEGTESRKKGLLTALRQSANGENTDNKHLNAYVPYNSDLKGLTVHEATGNTHVRGLVVSEEIVSRDENGNARKVNSGIHVQIKNAISSELDLNYNKWRQYKLSPSSVVFKNRT